MRRVIGVMSFAVLVLFIPQSLLAQAGSIRGRVVDSLGGPISGAVISVEGRGLRATSNDQGEYQIRSIPEGTYSVRVRVIGFNPTVAVVTVASGETVTQDFTVARVPFQLAPIDVVVGSRARHTAAEELAVPVDVYTAEDIQEQGTTETSQILQSLSPSVNFPRQTVTDATDIVRPFTLRGLSPDHTLVLLNGWRRHQTAVVNTFAYGTGAGSSGVDLNALPASAIDRIEVLRDGASAQYGSDAIAGVVNIVTKEGRFAPFVNGEVSRFTTGDYPDDGTSFDVNGGVGFGLGLGSLGLFAEYRDRNATNRAWADPSEICCTGVADSIDSEGNVVVKRNDTPQPNHHWGDGEAKDIMTFANYRMPLSEAATSEIYAFGGFSFRQGTGNGFRRYGDGDSNWPNIFPVGYLPTFDADATDYSVAGGWRGATRGWSVDFGGSLGHNDFEYNLSNNLNVSLGPCLGTPCAPGPDGILGNADDPGIPNQTSFFAGRVLRREFLAGVNVAKPLELGLPSPVNLALGAAFRRENYKIRTGETASWIDGGHPNISGDPAQAGSQVFTGFRPVDATDQSRNNFGIYADVETNLTPQVLANVAARFETYSDFGERVTGKVALRYQPSPRLVLRAAANTGFRAPGLGQSHFSHITTNFIFDPSIGQRVPIDVGNFPVDNPASLLLGSRPLEEETSVNLSAGFALSPSDNFTITADYFRIAIDDRTLLGATFDDDTTLAILARNGFTNIGGIQYFTNGLDTRTQGVDVTANLRVPAGASGTLELIGGVNYTKNEITRVDPLPAVLQNSDEAGLLDVVTRVAIEEERPDWRVTLTGQYSIGFFRALARASYFGRFASAQPGFCDACREEYGSKTLLDAEVGYQFGLVGLAVGARNIFDTYPDQASAQNSFDIFPWAAASPFGYNGRQVYARTTVDLARFGQ